MKNYKKAKRGIWKFDDIQESVLMILRALKMKKGKTRISDRMEKFESTENEV